MSMVPGKKKAVEKQILYQVSTIVTLEVVRNQNDWIIVFKSLL